MYYTSSLARCAQLAPLNSTHKSLVLFMSVCKLHKSCGRPQKTAGEPEHCSAKEGKPRVASSVIVPQASDVQRVAERTNHEAYFRSQSVDERTAKESNEGE